VFRAYPTTGGFSRTAVNDQAGARTTLAAVVSAGVIAVTLLFLTGLFRHLPKSVLAAIVMVAVFKLIDWREARFLWRIDRRDFFLMAATFVATLSLGIENGILVGVVASLIVVVFQSSKPHSAVVGRLPGSNTYRNVDRNPEAETTDGVVILRLDASLYFANTAFFKERVLSLVDAGTTSAFVFDFYPVNKVDATAIHVLRELVLDLASRGIGIFFSGVKGPVMDRFAKAEINELVGTDRFFHEVSDAANAAEASLLSDAGIPSMARPERSMATMEEVL
jgi:SulP family sulfate permease